MKRQEFLSERGKMGMRKNWENPTGRLKGWVKMGQGKGEKWE